MLDRLIEIGKCYGMEMTVGKPKVMRTGRQPSPVQIVTDQKQPENVEFFSCFGSMISVDARYTREIKSSIGMARAAFKEECYFYQQRGLTLKEETRKVLNLEQNFVWF
jgi:hypothetical protein